MILVAANNLTLVGAVGENSTVTTDPVAMEDNNYVNAGFNVHVLFAGSGSPTVTATYTIQGSNDGQNFSDISSLTDSLSAPGLSDKAAGVTYAYIRAQFSVNVSGTSGDWGVATFDLHLNIMFN